MTIDVAVEGDEVCSFEIRVPKYLFATRGGDTWLVIVRRIDRELRTIDVRVDRILDSGEADGCRTEDVG